MPATPAIIIEIINYQDFHQIFTVFSEHFGLIKLFGKYTRSKNKPVLTPAMNCEFVFETGKGNLLKLQEFTILESHARIHMNFDCIKAALECLEAIKKSQYEGKPSPNLYALLAAILAHLPQMNNPKSLIAAFYLKILLHEGIIAFQNQKMISPPFFITEEEGEEMFILALTRSLTVFSSLDVTDEFFEKTKRLFFFSLQNSC